MSTKAVVYHGHSGLNVRSVTKTRSIVQYTPIKQAHVHCIKSSLVVEMSYNKGEVVIVNFVAISSKCDVVVGFNLMYHVLLCVSFAVLN